MLSIVIVFGVYFKLCYSWVCYFYFDIYVWSHIFNCELVLSVAWVEFEFKAGGESHNQGVSFYWFHIPTFWWLFLTWVVICLQRKIHMCDLCLTFLILCITTLHLVYWFKLDSYLTSACRGLVLRSWSLDLSLRMTIL